MFQVSSSGNFSDIYSNTQTRPRHPTSILTKSTHPHKTDIKAQASATHAVHNTRALRKLHQGHKNSGICKQNPYNPLGMGDPGQLWKWADVGSSQMPREAPTYPTLTGGKGDDQPATPSKINHLQLFAWITDHLAWLSQYDTVYVWITVSSQAPTALTTGRTLHPGSKADVKSLDIAKNELPPFTFPLVKQQALMKYITCGQALSFLRHYAPSIQPSILH